MKFILASRKDSVRAGGILLGMAAVALCFWRIGHDLDLRQLADQAADVQPTQVGLSLLIYSAVLWLSAYEWTLLLPAEACLPVGRLYRIQAVMSLLQNTVHHFAGQGYAIYQLVRRERLESVAAVSLIAVDQVAEGLAKLALIGPVVLFFALPGAVGNGVQNLGLGVPALSSLLLVLLLTGRCFESGTCAQTGKWPAARHWLVAGYRHLRRLIRPRTLLFAIVLALSKKIVRALALLCLQRSLSIPLAWYVPFMVVAAIDLVTLIPLVPGNLGVFEAAVCLIYRSQGLDGDRALLAALLYHGVALTASTLPGLCVLWLQHAVSAAVCLPETTTPAKVPILPQINMPDGCCGSPKNGTGSDHLLHTPETNDCGEVPVPLLQPARPACSIP